MNAICTFKGAALAGLLTLGLTMAPASAGGYGHIQVQFGNVGVGHVSSVYAGHVLRYPSHVVVRRSIHDYRGPAWHNTTHLDYHPPTIRRHGNHYHIQPGHYDVYRTGHRHW